jgi:ankyrin repeat protein
MWASYKGNREFVKALLANGAEVNAKDNYGYTALMAAAASRRGHPEVVEALLAKGAEVNVKNEDGRTALMSASSAGKAEVVQLLLAKGADVNAKDNWGNTALDIASYRANSPKPEIQKMLIQAGAKKSWRQWLPFEFREKRLHPILAPWHY